MQTRSFFPSSSGLARAAVALAFLGLAGCGGSASALFPDFPAKKASIQQSMICSDYVVLDATMGDTTVVDVAGNQAMAVALMDEVSNQLNGMEYHVGNRLFTSMGLPLDPGNTARVIHTLGDKNVEEALLPLKHPPFYLYRVFEKDTALRGLLASFYSSLMNSPKIEGQPNPVIREAVPLGKTIGGGTWFVLLTAGYNIPVGREHGLEPPQWGLSSGQIGMYRSSHVVMMLFVVDTETGELLWADQIHEQGGTIHQERVLRIAQRLVSRLP